MDHHSFDGSHSRNNIISIYGEKSKNKENVMTTILFYNIGILELILIAFAVISLVLVIPFAIFDTIRSKELSTAHKFLWILFILVAPYLGAVVYLFWGRKQKAL
jgi:uncharacterized membrane protein YqjE